MKILSFLSFHFYFNWKFWKIHALSWNSYYTSDFYSSLYWMIILLRVKYMCGTVKFKKYYFCSYKKIVLIWFFKNKIYFYWFSIITQSDDNLMWLITYKYNLIINKLNNLWTLIFLKWIKNFWQLKTLNIIFFVIFDEIKIKDKIIMSSQII